ncbi:MAG: hypothetical protein LBU44_09765 [Mediterranea sp.]|jgi:hypothetical protein|nr:hypothetical protein [Mediterranea sp.]
MKTIIAVFFSFFVVSSFCYAQDKIVDVVYLKNGSMIRGQIIEQRPNQSLKIKTSDGSIFAYDITEVEKMTKEQLTPVVVDKKIMRGYKGFVTFGHTSSGGDAGRLELNTTHGYQFNNHIFLGGGVGYHYYNKAETYAIPLFIHFRVNFVNINKKVTPFGYLKTGYSQGDLEGEYASIGIGLRFGISERKALNLTIGSSYQDYDYSYSMGHYDEVTDTNGFSIKFGFEF